MKLKGKIAYVTGGASGIGAAAATAFAAEGAHAVFSDIDEARGKDVLAQITGAGGAASFIRHDVADLQDWNRVEEYLKREHGGADIMVNNAGVGAMKNIEDVTIDDWRRVMAINLDSVFLGSQMAIRLMKPRGGGSIINVSSVYGLVSEAQAPAYSASKGGVRLLTKSIALYCAEEGLKIRCNSVHPGFIHTRIGETDMMTLSEDHANALFSRIGANIPMAAFGEPEDIANAMVYLASEDSRYVTGTELVIDGGFSIR